MRKYLMVVSMAIALTIGVVVSGESADAQGINGVECWSSDDVAQGYGYYRCVPSLKCKWVDNRLPEGDTDVCLTVVEDEEISPE